MIIERFLPDTTGLSIADVGGGPGPYAFWLADKGQKVAMFGRILTATILVLLVSSAIDIQGSTTFAHPHDGVAAADERISGADSLAAAMERGDVDRVRKLVEEGRWQSLRGESGDLFNGREPGKLVGSVGPVAGPGRRDHLSYFRSKTLPDLRIHLPSTVSALLPGSSPCPRL